MHTPNCTTVVVSINVLQNFSLSQRCEWKSKHSAILRHVEWYEACRPIGKFFMLFRQNCRRPWSFTYELCSFDSGRSGLFEWDVFEMAAPIQSPAKYEVPRWDFSRATHRKEMSFWIPLWLEMKHGVFTALLNPSNSHCTVTTMMRWKKKAWRGSNGRRQTSMTRGYGSWFQDLINVWTTPATMLKNKVMYRQFIHSVAFVN